MVLATRNVHKLVELRRILAAAGLGDVDLVGVDAYPDAPEVAETGDTFEANALLKARAIMAATGEIAVADDSGLTVQALGGMPGILSARWSGDLGADADRDATNLRLVLAQVADVPDARRGATFECAAVLVFPNGAQLVAYGSVAGTLTRSPRGSNGFGYDPIFVPVGSDRTTAEMSAAEKDEISHRGRAFRELARLLLAASDTTAHDGVGSSRGSAPVANHDDTSDGLGAPALLGSLDLDGIQLPVYELAEFNGADISRVKSFSTNFGTWQLPPEVAALLATPAGAPASVEWIHDTGELVLLGGVPTQGQVAVDVSGAVGFSEGMVPAFLGGSSGGIERDPTGGVRELFKSEVMPVGSRVALLAHVKHGPKIHELLWGWHREHGKPTGWQWLVERLARLEADGSDDHLA